MERNRVVVDVREFMSALPAVLHGQGMEVVPVTLEARGAASLITPSAAWPRCCSSLALPYHMHAGLALPGLPSCLRRLRQSAVASIVDILGGLSVGLTWPLARRWVTTFCRRRCAWSGRRWLTCASPSSPAASTTRRVAAPSLIWQCPFSCCSLRTAFQGLPISPTFSRLHAIPVASPHSATL